jgi:hypothetical protein
MSTETDTYYRIERLDFTDNWFHWDTAEDEESAIALVASHRAAWHNRVFRVIRKDVVTTTTSTDL